MSQPADLAQEITYKASELRRLPRAERNAIPARAAAEFAKTRPAVVVSADSVGRLPLRIVVPVTDWIPSQVGLREPLRRTDRFRDRVAG